MRYLMLMLLLWGGSAFGEVRVAVIGDFGTDNANEAAVADMVKEGLRPEIIVTTGDNIYFNSPDYDRAIGKYYSEYIGNYKGSHGNGAAQNRFFPALGNHDYFGDNCNAYLDFFTLPGNERYYSFVHGDIGFFMVNSDSREPDGSSSTSAQAMWLSNELRRVTTQWKVVVVHHPPYSSSGSDSRLRWPFAQWGAQVVIAGHAHNYERIERDGIVYIVNGAGGAGLASFGETVAGSKFRHSSSHGAMLMWGDLYQLNFDFYSVEAPEAPLDSYTLTNRNPPTGEIPQLMVSRQGNELVMQWEAVHTGFNLKGSTRLEGSAWENISHRLEGNLNTARTSITGTARYFRLQR